MKLSDAETPHAKAAIIEKAVLDTHYMLKIVTPFKDSSKIGADEYARILKFLLVEMCK
jgi:hypothetical protein